MAPTEQEKLDAMLREREESERTRGISRHYEPGEDQPWWMFLPPEEAALARTVETAKARPGAEAASRARIRQLGGPERWEDVGGVYRRKAPAGTEDLTPPEVYAAARKKYPGLTPRAREIETGLGTRGTRLKEQADRAQVEADEDRKRATGLAEQGKLREAQFFEQRAEKRARTATDLSAQSRDVLEKARGERGWIGGRPAALGPTPGAMAAAGTLAAWDRAGAEEPEEELVRPRTPEGVAALESVTKLKKSGQWYPPGPEGEAQYRADARRVVQEAELAAGEPEEGEAPSVMNVHKMAQDYALAKLGKWPETPEEWTTYWQHFGEGWGIYSKTRAGGPLPTEARAGEPGRGGHWVQDAQGRWYQAETGGLPFPRPGSDRPPAAPTPPAAPAAPLPAGNGREATPEIMEAATQQLEAEGLPVNEENLRAILARHGWTAK